MVDAEYAWFGVIILALFPRFWGHSFFNPKDIPFAAIFTLGTLLGGCLIRYYLKVEQEQIRVGRNRITLYSLLYGILVGLVTGTRIGGLFLLLFIALAHLGVTIADNNYSQSFFRFWRLYVLILIAWFLTITIVHPASWSNPILWLYDCLTYLSKHPWKGNVFFEGQSIQGSFLPWYYLPKMFVITTPVFLQILFCIGLFLVLAQYRRVSSVKKAFTLLILLQIFFLPSIAILRQSTIYGGIRQFLFVLPGVATLSGIAIASICRLLPQKIGSIVALSLMIAISVPILTDMATLHPYEYIYYNRIIE
ncbi:MAG: hypothetical protein QNJ74_12055 [Trichodesmium sp. MO_231.B1]|nr:hypothetical protein [Trichodesmium sp. MO_231.B1]